MAEKKSARPSSYSPQSEVHLEAMCVCDRSTQGTATATLGRCHSSSSRALPTKPTTSRLAAAGERAAVLMRRPPARPEIARDRLRSPEIARDRLRSPEIVRDHPGSPETTQGRPRSPEIALGRPRSPKVARDRRDYPRSPEIAETPRDRPRSLKIVCIPRRKSSP